MVISLNLIKINNIVAMKMGKLLFDIGIWYTHGRDYLPALRRRDRARFCFIGNKALHHVLELSALWKRIGMEHTR